MKSIMKWIAGIFLAFSLILSFFTPFEKSTNTEFALTLSLCEAVSGFDKLS